jgi:hypothetical protein
MTKKIKKEIWYKMYKNPLKELINKQSPKGAGKKPKAPKAKNNIQG